MNIPKQLLTLEIAYDLISKVHTNICNSKLGRRDSELPDITLDILRQILILDKKIKEVQGSDNNAE